MDSTDAEHLQTATQMDIYDCIAEVESDDGTRDAA